MDIHAQTLTELAAGLDKGEFTSVELTQALLDRISAHNTSLNAFITVTSTEALAAASRADKARASGHAGALNGLPIIHKDIFCTQGIKTTCGSKMLDNFVSPYDATVVQKLGDAGAVVLGKTNMDEFAMGSSTENSIYGASHNPWDPSRACGGSSGGSAAAVAAGLVPLAFGSDTGGSIRQPASFCGVVGLKPTYGRVSRWGLVAFASSLDQIGPLTRTVSDAALALEIIAGHDKRDSTSVPKPLPRFRDALTGEVNGLKIGLPKEYFVEEGVEPGVLARVRDAIAVLEEAGAEFVDVSLPHTKYALPAYYIVAPAEASSNLARYDGVRYGLRVPGSDIIEQYENTRSEGFGAEVKRRVLIGTYVLSAGYYDAYYLKAQKVRTLIKRDFEQVFEDVDVLLAPATPGPAFAMGEKSGDPIEMYLNDIFTVPANMSGLPGISVPAGLSGEGTPLGLQLISKAFDEEMLFRVGKVIEDAAGSLKGPDDWWSIT